MVSGVHNWFVNTLATSFNRSGTNLEQCI